MNRLSHSKIIPYNMYQGYSPDTNNYLYRVTDTDFDDKTEVSLVIFFENQYSRGVGPANGVFFSMWYDTTNDTGLKIWAFANTLYSFFADGSGGMTAYGVTFVSPDDFGGGGASQSASPLNCIATTINATSNSHKLYVLSGNEGAEVGSSGVATSGLGALGTNTEIRITNDYGGSTTSSQLPDENKIIKVSLWTSKALSNAELQLLTDQSATIEDGVDGTMLSDVGYSAAGVTQPEHEWVMNSVRRGDGVHNQTLEDTGINVNLGEGYSAGHTDAVVTDGTNATVANIQGKEVFKSDGTLIGECTTRNTNNSITFGEGLVIDLDDDESLYVAQIPDTGSAGNKPLSIYGPKTPGHRHKA